MAKPDLQATVPYVLLANGQVAVRFLEHTEQHGNVPMLVVLNTLEKQRLADEIRTATQRIGIPVLEWSSATRDAVAVALRQHEGAWILSVYFGHVVDEDLLAAAGWRAVNLHASLLPWCRGANTNVYPLLEHCPAGVTLHAMTRHADAGNILLQREVPVRAWDTAGTLYRRLEHEALRLLQQHWPEGVLAAWPGRPQADGGSEHKSADFHQLDSYSLDGRAEARAFFDLLRARTFPPHAGLRVIVDGRMVEAAINLKEIDSE